MKGLHIAMCNGGNTEDGPFAVDDVCVVCESWLREFAERVETPTDTSQKTIQGYSDE